jgi:hypothetical protein
MRGVTVAGLLAGLLGTVGCGCGASLAEGYTDAGVVQFSVAAVGDKQILQVPVEANSGSETFVSGTVAGTGAEAFQVLTTFPMTVAMGLPATIEVQYSPSQLGTATASLYLDTATMGAAEIPLQGSVAVGDGG